MKSDHRREKRKYYFRVQTAPKTFKLHVPSPGTVLCVATGEELIFLLDSSAAALFDDLKTVENMLTPSNTYQSIWKAK